MIVAAPMNEEELRNLMYTASMPRATTAFTIRYPRGAGIMANWRTKMQEVEIGKGRLVREGEDLAILSLGHVGNYAIEAAEMLAKEQINVAVYDMRFAKPLDKTLLIEVFEKYDKVITIEDGCLMGGFGSAIVEFIVREGGGFTLTAFIFHGIYKLGMTGLILLDEDQKRQHEN